MNRLFFLKRTRSNSIESTTTNISLYAQNELAIRVLGKGKLQTIFIKIRLGYAHSYLLTLAAQIDRFPLAILRIQIPSRYKS